MTNPCALVISVFLRPVHTRRRRCVQQLVSPLLVVPTELRIQQKPTGLSFWNPEMMACAAFGDANTINLLVTLNIIR